ncbi:MAG: methyltransferase, TIGR04325 family [Patescibacteria group bacterium]|jgi:putative methyltransferase (TIGR04325 family)
MLKLKQIIKKFIPPIITEFYHVRCKKYGFFGNYPNWQSALADSTGYNLPLILEKVKQARLKVLRGEAVYERDSVNFDKIKHSWPMVAALLWIAGQNNNRLNVLDFGGSLGTSYFQNLPFIKHLPEINWNIVEQQNFVKIGKELFSKNESLKFYPTIESCLFEQKPMVVILSGVWQYLEKPYDMLEKIISLKIDYLLFDRTTFIAAGADRLTIQKVPPRIYEASYPAWFFNLEKFTDFFAGRYEIIADFASLNKYYQPGDYLDLGDTVACEKGFLLKKQSL